MTKSGHWPEDGLGIHAANMLTATGTKKESRGPLMNFLEQADIAVQRKTSHEYNSQKNRAVLGTDKIVKRLVLRSGTIALNL